MRAAVYVRISSDRVGGGLGVARQREDCERLIADRGWAVVAVYEDNDISAYSGKTRPSYRQLLTDITGGLVDVVVAWHTDRLHRSPLELEEWIDACERHGVTTVTVRAGELDLATAAGRMVARMLGAAARHESEQKSERIRRARQQGALAGNPNGSLGYGYRRDSLTGNWVVVDEEAAVVRDAAQRLLAGESLRSVTLSLTTRGVPTPTRAPYGWRKATLRQMVTAARYCGWREWTPAATRGGRGRGYGLGEMVAAGAWPAILTREQTEQLRLLFTDPTRRPPRGTRYLLSGILRCGRCGGPLNAHRNAATGRFRYHCFPHPGSGRCGGVSVAGAAVERLVTDLVVDALADSPLHAADPAAAAPDENATLTTMQRDRMRLEELAADYAAGRIARHEWLAARSTVAARVDAATRAIRDQQSNAVLRALPLGHRELAATWSTLSVDQRRAVIAAVADRIVVHPARSSRPVLDPERIEVIWRA